MNPKKTALVGAGLSSAVIAREWTEAGIACEIFEKRPHIAGNCHTRRDAETGVMVHEYGAHIFHTSDEAVWAYANRFADFGPYVNRVKAATPKGVYSLPINLLTLNQFFGRNFSPAEAEDFVAEQAKPFKTGKEENFEEVALSLVGEAIYRNFFYGYTKKQWGCEPSLLPGDVIRRLPIRFNYDDNYFRDPHQGIPRQGYTAMIEGILDHPGIAVHLNRAFTPADAASPEWDHVVWGGPIDAFYAHRHGRLSYRTVSWERERKDGDALGNAVLNYTAAEVPFTRKVEHKHFAPWETHAKTVVDTEFSRATGPEDDPFYPVRGAEDMKRLRLYAADAEKEKKVSFVGRLGTYRYLDMHVVIGESLRFAADALAAFRAGTSAPRFSVPTAKVIG